jgi:hypothetical protein
MTFILQFWMRSVWLSSSSSISIWFFTATSNQARWLNT